MNIAFKPEFEKFAVGQPVSRKEDPVLLRGEGRYSDDINLPGQLHAVFVRSRYAHGVLRSVDAAEAKTMPGVRGVIMAADLEAGGIKPMPAAAATNADGTPAPKPRQMALAATKVRYVGDPIAMVVAETAKQARDAAEAVLVEIDSLPAVTTARAAIAADAPMLHDEVTGQRVPELPPWRHGSGGCGIRECRARDEAVDPEQPHRGRGHGATVGGGRVRRGKRAVHAAARVPRRVRDAGGAEGRDRRR